jgi:hypothetical protein
MHRSGREASVLESQVGGKVTRPGSRLLSLPGLDLLLSRSRQARDHIVRKHVRPLLSRFYLQVWRRGRDFSAEFYIAQYPDVPAAGMDPYDHYVRHGRAEGRLGKMPELEVKVMGRFESLEPARGTVLVVSHEGSRTGAPVLSYNLVKKLLEKHNVVALFLGPGPLLEACHEAGAVVVGPANVRGSAQLSDLVIQRITDAVHVEYALINSIESRCVLPALAKRQVATVSLIHEFAAYTRPHEAFRDAVLWSGQTVFSSEITRDNAVASYPDLARNYPVIPQGRCILPREHGRSRAAGVEELARIHRVMRPPGFDKEGVVVLGAGFIHLRKGVDLFVECAARVLRREPSLPIRFVWVGKGYDPENDVSYSVYLADQIRRAGLEAHVHFMDEVADLGAAYAEADLLLLSSRLDPLPNVTIDALAGGLPVVCFDKTTGIAEILRANGLGEACVAAYLDTEDMARKVLAFAHSRELRDRVTERAAQVATATFDMARYVDRLERLAAPEVERAQQEQRDVQTISECTLPRLDYFLPPHARQRTREEAIRLYVRSWASGVTRRKLFPGFHPGIYLEQHGVAQSGVDPLADYLRTGRPRGPWDFEVVSSEEKARPLPASFRVGLHAHVYYPDVFPEMLKRLEGNRVRPDLLISVASEPALRAVQGWLDTYDGGIVDVRVVQNRGRDISAFLTEFGGALRDRYDVVGHLHTKKTADVKDAAMGRTWYQFLLENLLGGRAPMADIILGRMAEDPGIGMIFPDDPYVVGWDKNLPFVDGLLRDLGIAKPPRELAFPVGSMFWARPGALAKLFDLGWTWTDYPEEPLPYDGSLLHGLERAFGLIATSGGARALVTNVPGRTR